MGSHRAEHSEVIAASPAACFRAVTDFASYPRWQSAVKESRVLENSGDSVVVEFVVDAKVRRVRYVLRYHLEPPRRLWWEYVEGDLRSIDGDYEFEDLGDGTTRATYRVGLDAGRFVPGPIRSLLTSQVMRISVAELRERVEAAS